MSFALAAGVTGLKAHQKMLDVAGNNLANVNTTACKSSRINFSELLSQTIRKASQPTSTIGGTNPQQMGSGVGVAGITPNMAQGNIVKTGNPLDLAMEGEGYFVLSDGQQSIYTRAGAFAVDQDATLVDPATGYRVQRIGSVGEGDGFQIPGEGDIQIPYDVTMPANATSRIVVSGNLSADAAFDTPQIQKLDSDIAFTYGDGTAAVSTTEIDELDQYSGTLTSGTITIAGYHKDGTDFTSGLTLAIDGTTTIDTDKSRHKYVFVAPGQYNEQVLFSGYNIHLIGVSTRSNGDYGVVINYDGAIASTAVVAFSGAGLEIANICINCNKAIPALYLSDTSEPAHSSAVLRGPDGNRRQLVHTVHDLRTAIPS